MSEKPEADEYEDEEADEPVIEDGDVDLDQVNKELDLAKRRSQKGEDPAWRRLERLREEKHTAELTSDFEDYEIGDPGESGSPQGTPQAAPELKDPAATPCSPGCLARCPAHAP